jgi:superfamily II DNA or RNA helicase
MQTGQWMVCVDEYHHYGADKAWGQSVLQLPKAFLLAMSATPMRPKQDSAFGTPDVSVLYREAVEEKAVKELFGHAYAYRVDAIMEDGEVQSFTTSELVKEAGGDGEKIEKLRIRRKMRWSPKYVSPLVSIPIERMLANRSATGQPLQALVGAMSVSHAELVFKQISDMYPNLRVDWVGTGDNGRSDDENKEVLERFCPPKNDDGMRPTPSVDVLVHVGMAGEGLDCVYVSECVFLNNASLCNARIQDAGRTSRYLPDVEGNISFDSSSEFAPYVGEAIMDAMDDNPPALNEDDDPPKKKKKGDVPELPDEPTIMIFNMELLHIDSGDPQVQRMARVMKENNVTGVDYAALADDENHPEWQKIILFFKKMRSIESAPYNRESEIRQWKEAVENALYVVSGRVVRMMHPDGARPEKSLKGDINKRINSVKKRQLGGVQPDIEIYRKHYQWLKSLEQRIISEGVPQWLL